MARPPYSPRNAQESAAVGLERRLLRAWPWFVLMGVVLPALVALILLLLAPEPSAVEAYKAHLLGWFRLIGWTVVYWVAVLTLLTGCWVVAVMKGPERRADSLPLPTPDRFRA